MYTHWCRKAILAPPPQEPAVYARALLRKQSMYQQGTVPMLVTSVGRQDLLLWKSHMILFKKLPE